MSKTTSFVQALLQGLDVDDARGQALQGRLAFLDRIAHAIVFIQASCVKLCNLAAAEWHGYQDPGELIGEHVEQHFADQEAFVRVRQGSHRAFEAGEVYRDEMQLKNRQGGLWWASVVSTLVVPGDLSKGSVWVMEDVTEQRRAKQQLADLAHEQSLIFAHANVGIAFLRNRRVTRCNAEFERQFGYQAGEMQGLSTRVWYFSDEAWAEAGEHFSASLRGGRPFQDEMLLRRKDGTTGMFEVRVTAIDTADFSKGSICIVLDISDRKRTEHALEQATAQLRKVVEQRTHELRQTVNKLEQTTSEQIAAQERLERMALYDPLTELPNRRLLGEHVASALRLAQADGGSVALLFVDVDNFKNINDTLGHKVGDELLISFAHRVRQAVRDYDTVARLGGDEFAFMLPDTEDAGAERVAKKLLDLAATPFHVQGHGDHIMTPSIGIAMYPRDGADFDTLARSADAAMYEAKKLGKNGFAFFTHEFHAESDRRLRLGNALRKALEKGELSLRYQPQIDMHSRRVVGAEALLRWCHPQFGEVPPTEFIPVAESTGLIGPIGEWVLSTAVGQLSEWMRCGMVPMSIAVNLSVVQFRNANLPSRVSEILAQAGVPANLLELELTESVAMTNAEHASDVLQQLRAHGVCTAIDDFGTGYSSLSYLKQFRVNKLKIDRSFVRDITEDADDKAIVGAIIGMAQSLGIRTVAEGVETSGQLQYLREKGCGEAQGYLFAKPLLADEFVDFVQTMAGEPAD